jgi:hypothetical protein
LTDKKLQKLTQEWQKLLRLQDWRVRVEFVEPLEMEDPGSMGQCQTDRGLRQVKIKLRSPEYNCYENEFNQDVEATLVHELLHVYTNLIIHAPDSTQGLFVEQAIEAMTMALLSLKRGEYVA